MAERSPLAGLLDRAGQVFALAGQLAQAFTDESNQQGQNLKTVYPTAWNRQQPTFAAFCVALRGLRDDMQNPPEGFAPVAEVLMEAARIAKEISEVMQTSDGQAWQSSLKFRFQFNSVAEKGEKAIRAVKKALKLDDPFGFVGQQALKAPEGIDTTPAVPRPPAGLIESTGRAIPGILADMQPDCEGKIEMVAALLARKLHVANHSLAAAQWAIHEAVQAGRLRTGPVEVEFPSIGVPSTSWGGPALQWHGGGRGTKVIPTGQPAPFDSFKVVATDALWTWWRESTSVESAKSSPADAADSRDDGFAIRAARRAVAPEIEHLAAAYFEQSEPLRQALNRALQASSCDQTEELFKAAKLFPCGQDGACLLDCRKPSPSSPDHLARYALVQMLLSAFSDDRARFEEWQSKLRLEPDAGALKQRELCVCAAQLVYQSRRISNVEFIPKVKEVLRKAGLQLSWRTTDEILDTGVTLTVTARRALACWVDADFNCAPAVRNGLLDPPDVPANCYVSDSADAEVFGVSPDAKPTGEESCATSSPRAVRSKRSTERGEARTKLIAALTKHHQYAGGGCLNLDPIKNNKLAKNAGVEKSTASAFFQKEFGGHSSYKVRCRTDAAGVALVLKVLNGELSGRELLYGRAPRSEGRDDEE